PRDTLTMRDPTRNPRQDHRRAAKANPCLLWHKPLSCLRPLFEGGFTYIHRGEQPQPNQAGDAVTLVALAAEIAEGAAHVQAPLLAKAVRIKLEQQAVYALADQHHARGRFRRHHAPPGASPSACFRCITSSARAMRCASAVSAFCPGMVSR